MRRQELETIIDVLEVALGDPNFIDTTSGGGANPREAQRLREKMLLAQYAAQEELKEYMTFVIHLPVTVHADPVQEPHIRVALRRAGEEVLGDLNVKGYNVAATGEAFITREDEP